VPRGFALVAAARADDHVRVFDARYGVTVDLAPEDRDRVHPGWVNYIAVVVKRLASNFPTAALGVDIAMASDLPRAAGASSSSALVVGVAHALMARASLTNCASWKQIIRTELDLASYLGTVENGRAFGSLAGTAGVGTNGGSQDHMAILACRAGRLTAFGYAPARHLDDAPMPDGWRFVIMTSGVHAGKASDAKDRFNRASGLVAGIVSIWNAANPNAATTLGEILTSDPDAADRLRSTLATSRHPEFAPDDLLRRLAHFIAEDARVPTALEAFRAADARVLGDIAAASQAGASEGLGNQIEETRTLARTALSAGAFASSSFGAGFGGCVWALVEGDDEAAATVARAWSVAYRTECPHVSGVDWFIATPAPGLTPLAV
jgi:galactokinase